MSGKAETVVENEATPAALTTLAKELVTREQIVEKLEAELKIAKENVAGAEKKLVDEMTTQGVKAFKTTELGGFRQQAVMYPNVVDREALNAFVKKNKKLAFLYSMNVNGTKLRSYVKELLENGKKVPPGVDPYTTMVIRHF
jgi:hypothetical protein